jgi:anti-sigma-K factor RskA
MTGELHTLTGAYAADALPDQERELFEQHLASCQTCAQEVRELRETTARLATVVSVAPPDGLWERVRGEIANTRQLPPSLADRRSSDRAPRRAWRHLPSRLVAVAAAALLVIAVSLGGLSLSLADRLDRSTLRNDRIAAVLAAPDVQTHTASASGVGSGTVVVSQARQAAVFVASGLRQVPTTRTYQLWVIDRGQARSAGLLGSGGKVVQLLDGGLAGADAVGVTVEPRGGSPQPTSTPVLLVGLA